MSVRPFLIALRDIKLYLADKGDLAFSLLLPVALLALMLGAFSDTNEFNTTGYIVDRDGGPAAREVIARLDEAPGLELVTLRESDARGRLNDVEILLYVEIPPGYSESIAVGNPLPLVIHRRGNGGQEGQIVAGYVSDVAERVSAEPRLRGEVEALLTAARVSVPADTVGDAVGQALDQADTDPPVRVTEESVGGGEELATVLFPNLATMFVIFAIALNAQAFVRERKQGTMERLLITRLTPGEFFLGAFLGNVLRGVVQILVLFGLAALVFDFFTLASLLQSLVFAVLVVAAASALALLLGTLARTPDQVTWSAVFLTTLMSVFGGTFISGIEDTALATVARFTLNFWANSGFHDLLIDGAGLGGIGQNIVVLLGVTVAALVLSRLLFRPEIARRS